MGTGNLWERFDGIVTANEVTEAKNQFEPMEEGLYTVALEAIEAGESKDGLPMVKGKFRTDNNRVIFYNQLLQNINYPNMTAVNIGEAVAFLSALKGSEIEFTTLSNLGEEIDLIQNYKIGEEYTLKLTYGKKDFDQKFPKVKVIVPVTKSDVPEVF